MKIKIITAGKIKAVYLKEAEQEYAQRIQRYAQLSLVSVKMAPEALRNIELIQSTEATSILGKLQSGEFLVVLDANGNQFSSPALAEFLQKKAVHSQNKVTFVIGGSVGLHQSVLDRADLILSFSKMTFPHEMAKVILLEQIYRAFTILNGEKYHK